MYTVVEMRFIHSSINHRVAGREQAVTAARVALGGAQRLIEGIAPFSVRAAPMNMANYGAGANDRLVAVRVEIGPIDPNELDGRIRELMNRMVMRTTDCELVPLQRDRWLHISRALEPTARGTGMADRAKPTDGATVR